MLFQVKQASHYGKLSHSFFVQFSNLLDSFKKIVFEPDYNPEAVLVQTGKTTVKELSNTEVLEAVASKNLTKFTVPAMKLWMTKNKIKVLSKWKKEDYMKAIIEYCGTHDIPKDGKKESKPTITSATTTTTTTITTTSSKKEPTKKEPTKKEQSKKEQPKNEQSKTQEITKTKEAKSETNLQANVVVVVVAEVIVGFDSFFPSFGMSWVPQYSIIAFI